MKLLAAPPDQAAALPGSERAFRRGADGLRAVLVCIVVGALAGGDWAGAFKALLVLPPAFLGRFALVPSAFDMLFAIGLVAEAVGTLIDAYDAISWADTLAHLALPLLCAPLLYGTLTRLRVVVPPGPGESGRLLLGAAAITAGTVLGTGAAWELVEWAADSVLGTNYSLGYRDTLTDLLADGAAALAGGALVAAWLRQSGDWGMSDGERS